MSRDLATERQVQASEPGLSTWLSANAGSGKTRVLTDRVARLLLDGVPPQNILCLTYTKAAASEMQNRLFERLGQWAMRSDDALAADLAALGADNIADLAQARRLFARAIETPGGLKIQTIHSFCATLLRRFPLEARVTPQFTEMDDRAARLLRDEIVDTIAAGPDAPALHGLARFYTGEDLASFTARICDNRLYFAEKHSESDIWAWFELAPGFNDDTLAAQAFAPGDGELLRALIPIMNSGTKTDMKAAAVLSALDLDQLSVAHLDLLEALFLTGVGAKAPFSAKIGSFPNKVVREGAAAHLMPQLEQMMRRIESARETRNRLFTARKTLALHRFARPFLAQYQAQKLRRGWVDFDDLIQKAAHLLSDPALATWVLYRLDGFIDHILVDEAQDTSPLQWQLIDDLTRDFTSGDSARSDVHRTLFVVGDPKQSIYSFQGAEPAAFSRMQAEFGTRLSQIGEQLQSSRLEYSFRSSPAVLELVDHCLRDKPGLGAETLHHIAFQNAKPGRVDLWPVVDEPKFQDDRHWTDTTDIAQPESVGSRLATDIAAEIKRMLKCESIQAEIEFEGVKKTIWRRVQPGDILILVRGRKDGLFNDLIRACKQANLPIAGADQLRIGAELAVKDLVALLRFLVTPEDDLSLAACLRSPLFGLSEADLYSLAQPRPKNTYLWSALRDHPDHKVYVDILQDLRKHADFLRPYDLIERILIRHGGRSRLLARLGSEAEDGIDALLSQALNYERLETPSLTGFLIWMDTDEVTVKRQMDSAGNQIRVMTVHGAKGLEAPIVFLPDTRKPRAPNLAEITRLPGSGNVVWRPVSAQMPSLLAPHNEAEKRSAFEEWIRLLYVAMTRAGQWLIVAAAGDVGDGDQSWYSILQNGTNDARAVDYEFPTGCGLRLETGAWQDGDFTDQLDEKPSVSLPDWAKSLAVPPAPARVSLSPSDLGGAKIVAGESDSLESEAAKRRGTQIHQLLETLPLHPKETWADVAASQLAIVEESETIDPLLTEVTAVLENPVFKEIFGPSSYAEIAFSADIAGTRFNGIIDRLVVAPDHVLVVDFKSNAAVPSVPEETPEGILRQLTVYRAAIEQIYPEKRIEVSIIWTRHAVLMPIPDALLDGALSRLDATAAAT